MSVSKSASLSAAKTGTVYSILFAISAVHLLNDSMQAVIPALFPVYVDSLHLTYGQIGWLVFALNMTSSVIQPFIGILSDKRPLPWMLPFGMMLSLLGMAGMAIAPSFWWLIPAVMFVGFGSAIFHPEGSRVVYYAAGERRGLAQSIYQVGGNTGHSLAPLMTIFIFLPLGQPGAIWGTLLAAAAIIVLLRVVPWYSRQLSSKGNPVKRKPVISPEMLEQAKKDRRLVLYAISLIIVIVFARSWFGAAIGSFYQFYVNEHYGLSMQMAQVPILLYMISGVIGTLLGGLLSDRLGRKKLMVLSIAGAVPLALLLPHLSIGWVYPIITLLGFILQSGFSVSVVYAQELMPTKVGLASGLITGFAFGLGALGAVVLGNASDWFGLGNVMVFASLLPLLGLVAFALPKDRRVIQ